MGRQLFRAVLLAVGVLLLWWGLKLNAVYQAMVLAHDYNEQSITAARSGDFEQAKKNFLALQSQSESVRRHSINYALVKNFLVDDVLPPARTLQENIQDVEKLSVYDFYSQLVHMTQKEQAALDRDELPEFRYSYHEAIQEGALTRVQRVYKKNKAEILQKRKENLNNIAVYRPVSGSASSSFPSAPMDHQQTPSSLLSEVKSKIEVESKISGLLMQSNAQLSQKNAKKAYELAHEASEYLISALASKKISGEDYLRLDEKISKQTKKAINAPS
jgi:hypothetical protein